MITLNEKQLEAVNHLNGRMMVLAGPGSGKTTVITYRIKQLIDKHNIPPERILVITFTKVAANEMSSRFKNMTNSNYKVVFGTFHSIFFKIIRMALGYKLENVLKEDERKFILKNIINLLKIKFEDEDEFLKDISSEISLMKNELIDSKYYNPIVCSTDDYKMIVDRYEKFKIENKKIDFDDMLCICWKVLNEDKKCLEWWQKKYDYILIDEFQDINRVQYETICLLSQKHNNLFIVGDDDQSIYKFRGARPEFLLKFPKDFDKVKAVTLNINYRSTDNIISIANKIIENNKQRYTKNIIGTNKKGKSPILLKSDDIESEALLISKYIYKLHNKGVDWHNIAIIFRTNIQARAFVDKFMDMNFPFVMRDEIPNIYDHWISKDILSYIKLALDFNKNDCLERIINKPTRYINKSLIQEARRKEGSLFYNLIELENMQIWQRTRLEELEYHLLIIKSKTPLEALKYIRNVVNYDDYIKRYGEFRKTGVKGLFEIADELKEAAKNYKTHEEFLTHIDDYISELKNQKIIKKDDRFKNSITLTTMHGAKGLEFDVVFIASVIEGVIPHEKSKTIFEIEEERRLFYVGVTRAKKLLYISTVDSRYEGKAINSHFLTEINFI